MFYGNAVPESIGLYSSKGLHHAKTSFMKTDTDDCLGLNCSVCIEYFLGIKYSTFNDDNTLTPTRLTFALTRIHGHSTVIK